MARRYDSGAAKRRVLTACVRLFWTKGYTHTTVAEILREADVSASTFQNIFHTKDGVLFDLVKAMFQNQFDTARAFVAASAPATVLYSVETAIQLAITEINENIRDIYLVAYSQKETCEFIYQRMATELHHIFGAYHPSCTESDFYEFEIGSAGILRNYMAKRCDKYFTLEKKITRFLTMSLNAYTVPEPERNQILAYVAQQDIRTLAQQAVQKLLSALSMQFGLALSDFDSLKQKP